MKIVFPHRFDYANAAFVSGGCLVLIIMIALLWGGGQELYTVLKYRNPVIMTCQEYGQKLPEAAWVTVTEARFDFVNAAVKQSRASENTQEVFIPLRYEGEPMNGPIKILLASTKTETRDLMDNISNELSRAKSLSDVSTVTMAKLAELRTVSGVVRFGLNDDSKTHDKLGRLKLPLAKGYVIIDEGEGPSAVKGLSMFGLGLLLLGYNIKKALKSDDSQPAASQPPPLPPQQ